MTVPRSAWPPAAAVVAGLAVALLAAGQDGARGAGSAALGVAVVVGFFAAGLLPLLVVRGQEDRGAAFGAGVLLLNYTLRLAVAVLVLRLAARSGSVEPRWTTFAVIAGALAWTAATAAVVLRHDQAGHGLARGDR